MRRPLHHLVLGLLGILMLPFTSSAQEHSVARQWNDVQLDAIRNDEARPTVHARNLFHVSMAMYDAWAAYEEDHNTIFLGNTWEDYTVPFDGVMIPETAEERQAAQEEALSYAVYRLIQYRYQIGPTQDWPITNFLTNNLMAELGYDTEFTDTDYSTGSAAALGNYIAEQIMAFGLTDWANEQNNYENQFYNSVNDTLWMQDPGNALLTDPNRWQPLGFEIFFIGQGEDTLFGNPPFLSPEWGRVTPFALTEDDVTIYQRDGFDYEVYFDPGTPPMLDPDAQTGMEDLWKWNFTLVAVWSSHLDPTDGVLVDISPASLGNIDIETFPTSLEDHDQFYDLFGGGDTGQGYDVNPATGEPYEPQYVKRGDYGRILAEFWADGPDSETPPGHWYTILNYVNDHEMLEKKWMGKGDVLGDLEWDVKTYLSLGGTMHDAAIAAWGIKGWYDYIRPVSAIRWMAENGQSTDPLQPNYHPAGFPLIEGYVELVDEFDALAGEEGENVNEIKIKAWRGPDYILNSQTDEAGVGWILARDWWPYQRPSFVTPPFAGYVSGHSTFSRAAAELMTAMTGDAYFPGGMGIFEAPEDEFLVFEDGPSEDIELQWATYRDASDQCSLSRIWGGIHPPADDIPGRIIGEQIGINAFAHAHDLFDTQAPRVSDVVASIGIINEDEIGGQLTLNIMFNEAVDTLGSPIISWPMDDPTMAALTYVSEEWIDCDEFMVVYEINDAMVDMDDIDLGVTGLQDLVGNIQGDDVADNVFEIDTDAPAVTMTANNADMLNDDSAGMSALTIDITFDESMDMMSAPMITFPEGMPAGLTWNEGASSWLDDMTYQAVFDLTDEGETVDMSDIMVSGASDASGNGQEDYDGMDSFSVDTENPFVEMVASDEVISDEDTDAQTTATFTFSEAMDTSVDLVFTPTGNDPSNTLTNPTSGWDDEFNYTVTYDVVDANEVVTGVTGEVSGGVDANGNLMETYGSDGELLIDTENPGVLVLSSSDYEVTGSDIGGTVTFLMIFDEAMDMGVMPTLSFPNEDPSTALTETAADWINENTYEVTYDVEDVELVLADVDVEISGAEDAVGNPMNVSEHADFFDIDMTPISVGEHVADEMKLFPNPTDGTATLFLGEQGGRFNVRVYSIDGKMVNVYNNIVDTTLEITNTQSGTFLVEVFNTEDQSKRVLQLIVE